MNGCAQDIRTFYDGFASKLLNDYVQGNPRAEAACRFFAQAVSPADRHILVIGCGVSPIGVRLARRARAARVVASDVSPKCVRFSAKLFPHRRVDYRVLDVLADPIEGTFDLVVLPDVYEHIPRADRPRLHERLRAALEARGRIALSGPTPAHQAMLRAGGGLLQPVDEDVTLDDLREFAGAVGGGLAFYRLVSIWRTNDYFHAVIERGLSSVQPMTAADRYPLKGWPRPRTGVFLRRSWRRLRLAWAGVREA